MSTLTEAAEAVLLEPACPECHGTGWRIRKSDDAPVACIFCAAGEQHMPLLKLQAG